ncbi:MAG: methyltransferase family protein [Thermoanaerobaculia bacterium]
MFSRVFAAARGLVYASAFVAIWWWVVVAVRPLDRGIPLAIPAWARYGGFVLVAFGGVLVLSCVLAFALVGRGTPAPFDAPREFVAVGPYRVVRNPMYVGALAVIVGVGLILRSPAALAVAVLFVVLAHLFAVFYEEPTLERRFGESYRTYKESVNRWLPRASGRSP